jgi:hypothetical protein
MRHPTRGAPLQFVLAPPNVRRSREPRPAHWHLGLDHPHEAAHDDNSGKIRFF